jgi:hypothetical protein
LPTPAAQEPGWRHIEVVDKDGRTPSHHNQRWYHPETGRVVQKGLEQVVRKWPTPQARDATPRGGQAKRYLDPKRSNDLPDALSAVGNGGSLNPRWVEWLMGWPIGWTSCAPLATDKFQQWCEQHGICSE